MIVESFNVAGALAALEKPVIETRMCVSIKPETTIHRFVSDSAAVSINGWDFEPAPYAQFSGINSSPGTASDSMTITIDGRNLLSPLPDYADQVIQQVQKQTLRDRPVHVGLVVLNPANLVPIGILSEFIGIVDNSRLKYDDDKGSIYPIRLLSSRSLTTRRVAITYSDTGHTLRFGDRALRWISDNVFRAGKYPWNSVTASAQGAGGGGSPFGPRPRFAIPDLL